MKGRKLTNKHKKAISKGLYYRYFKKQMSQNIREISKVKPITGDVK